MFLVAFVIVPRIAASLIFLTVASCSPSLRLQHQSTVYFERCYVADFDPTIRAAEKRNCWSAWLEYYSAGQMPHRVRYAQHRDTALRAGETLAPVVQMPFDLWDTNQGAVFLSGGVSDESPAPTVEPPAAIALRDPPGDNEGPCAEVCAPRWVPCIRRCAAFPEESCADACEAQHRVCMAGCY